MNAKKSPGIFITVTTIIILSIGLVGFNAADDDPVISKIVNQLYKWLDSNPVEKVYLQTDKPYYSAGDDIWFKAYIMVNYHHLLSTLSGSVNVELIDELDSVKQWIKLPVANGVAWGDFKLTDTLHEGTYRIRAYTNWMRNAGPDYYYNKVISIGNAATNTVFTKSAYTYATINNRQKVNATINYSDINGKPIAGKAVTYKIRFNDKFIEHGKGATDNKGNLIIDFTNPANITKGSIITDIKLDEKSKITKTIAINATAGKVNVQFFPEGGSLINTVRSVVAFKAVGESGLGVPIKGTIVDNENKPVAEINSRHLGMGVFAITPQNGKSYKAQITYEDGSENTVNLPAALNSGYVLSINNSDPENVRLRVTGSADMANAGHVYILAQSGGETQFVASSKSADNNINTSIPKSKFTAGIVQFTLFSAKGDPLNERIAFIQHPNDGLKLNISSKTVTAPHEKIKIDLNALNGDDKPVTGAFSVSVIDENKVPVNETDETTILTHTLLTSDLKGYIEQPNYYFINSNETTRANLDLLMLTQGYRRFEWKPLLAGTIAPPVYQPEKLLQIAGTITNLSGKPVPHAKISLINTTGGFFILDSVTNEQGHFAYKNLVVKDSVRVVLKALTAKGGKNVKIVLDDNGKNDMVVKSIPLSAIKFTDNAQFNTYLKASKKLYDEEVKYGVGNHIVLKEVTIRDSRKPAVDKSSTNINGAGKADQVITTAMINKMPYPNLEVCLQSLAYGVMFRNGKAYLARNMGAPMLVLVDGAEFDDISILNQTDIGSVEVLKTISYTSLYGSRGANGVLVITTRRGSGSDASNIDRPGVMIYSPKGYYVARQFYSPQYDDPKVNQSVADLRSTIYWNPNVITDNSGHASIEYYNAAGPANYRVLIEGVDADGNLGYKVYHYKVQ